VKFHTRCSGLEWEQRSLISGICREPSLLGGVQSAVLLVFGGKGYRGPQSQQRRGPFYTGRVRAKAFQGLIVSLQVWVYVERRTSFPIEKRNAATLGMQWTFRSGLDP